MMTKEQNKTLKEIKLRIELARRQNRRYDLIAFTKMYFEIRNNYEFKNRTRIGG